MTKEKRVIGFRSPKATNTRRQIVTKTPLEENKSDETTVAVTTQESLDGIREKALRIASIDEKETGSRSGRWSRRIREGQDHELVSALVGQITKRRRHCRRL